MDALKPVDILTSDDGVQFRVPSGRLVHDAGNIKQIFSIIEQNEHMLEDYQIEFISSLRKFFQERGYLTKRQFYFLSYYYGDAAGDWGMAEEPF